MNNFFKNELELFKQDMYELGSFFLQPVTFGKKDENLMLKADVVEVAEKTEMNTFWKNEWDLFKKDISVVTDFLTQPVEFK